MATTNDILRVEFGDDIDGYLDWAKHGNLENENAPFLALDTFNVFMRNIEHICCYFSEHIVNRRDAHCIPSEELLNINVGYQVRSISYRLY